ncbi:Membrane alanyl aminopeptidase [Bacillus amyloliquefaciens]|nr:Membrane alanyl aminopeptidase [Bacillus amyloliquefaciens]
MRSEPRVCFLPTASGDSENYIARFYQAFHKLECETEHLSLFKPPGSDLRSFLMKKEIIYVGGNTRNMLVLWKEWGLDLILREAWESGIILAGLSAGAKV